MWGRRRGNDQRLLLAHRFNKAFGWKPLTFLFKGVGGPGRADFCLTEKPGRPGFWTLVRVKCKNQTCATKETRGPSSLRSFILEVGGGSACSGGEGPAQLLQPPNACPAPISYPVAQQPSLLSVCPAAPPQTGLTRLNTRAACPQPVGSATWQAGGGEKQLGHALGLRGQRGPPPALRGSGFGKLHPGQARGPVPQVRA